MPSGRKIASFGVVGVASAAVDLVAFNALRIPFGAPWAKAISMLLAALVAFIGNRQHTFRDHSGGGPIGRQLGTYLGLNLVGLGIAELCLLVSERGLGLHGVIADNISVNGVGFVIATAFRFWSYQRWVFGAPVVAAGGNMIDVDKFAATADGLAESFAAARPFPHVEVQGLLEAGPDLLESFPGPDWDGWAGLGDSYQTGKLTCDNIERIPRPLADIIRQMSEPTFLRALERITGIGKLLPDPHLVGGGLHVSGPGGRLSMHTDFHIYDAEDLYRRVNLILYLCPDWTDEDGGALELSDVKGREHAKVTPGWGNAVIFRTDDKSVHGFPNPVADGRYRRSIALYYYTAQEAGVFSGDATTHWREHGSQKGLARQSRFALYRLLLQASRAFSLLAHLVNPNQGMGWWKTRTERTRAKV